MVYSLPPDVGAVAVASFEMNIGQRFDWHRHPEHQLAWSERGVLAVTVGDRTWVLPSTRGLWIPSGMLHATEASSPAMMRSSYSPYAELPHSLEGADGRRRPSLLRELIKHLADGGAKRTSRVHAQRLLFETLTPLASAAILTPLPTDPRARRVADALTENPADGRDLAEFGRRAGASARTLSRLFVAETGMTFGQWRAQLRVRAALVHLASGMAVSATAERVGYESVSAFVAAFRRQTGVSPGSYFAE